MNTYLIRSVSLILIPALIADPSLAVSSPKALSSSSQHGRLVWANRFSEQALLLPQLLSFLQSFSASERAKRIQAIADRMRRWANKVPFEIERATFLEPVAP